MSIILGVARIVMPKAVPPTQRGDVTPNSFRALAAGLADEWISR